MSTGFFKEEEVRNKQANAPWKKSERDWMLDTYFAGGNGAHPNTIARKLGRNPKAIKRRLEQYSYNEEDCVLRYEPKCRTSRKGMRWTENERVMVHALLQKRVGYGPIAKLLCRTEAEIREGTGATEKEKSQVRSLNPVAATLDLVWAYRYIHFVYKQELISDAAYDDLVKEEVEFGNLKHFLQVKGYKGWPVHIRNLAMYLVEREKFKF